MTSSWSPMRGTACVAGVVALAVLVVALGVGPAAAADGTVDARWAKALARYAQDPLKNRRALWVLGREGTEGVPAVYLMALADSYLRSGRPRAARRIFGEVLAHEPAEPWASWAGLGAGWLAFRAGEERVAREHFSRVAAAGNDASAVAATMMGVVDATAGRGVPPELARRADDPRTPPGERAAAQLWIAYSKYWAADYDGARGAFARAVRDDPTGSMADDARYGSAWSRYRAGDREGAIEALRALAAGRSRGGSGPVTRQLVNLEQRALMRAGFRRYRHSPLRAPSSQSLLLDVDGVALAAAALRYLEGGREITAPPAVAAGGRVRARRDLEVTYAAARESSATAVQPPAAATPVPAPSAGGSGSPLVPLLLVLAGVVAVGFVVRAVLRGGVSRRV